MTRGGLPTSECPACGYRINDATPMEPGNVPKPGDLSACLRCAAPLAFTPELTVRLITTAEVAALPAAELRALRQAQAICRRADRPL